MRILITGATGLLGKVLIKKLLKENYQVIGISLKSLQDKEFFNNKYYKHYRVDLKNKKKLMFLLHVLKPNIIFHLAAYIPKSFDIQVIAEESDVNEIALKGGLFFSNLPIFPALCLIPQHMSFVDFF